MPLTRRRLFALGGGAALAHVLPAGLATAAAPRRARLESFSMPVPGPAAEAAAAGARRTTGVLRAPRRFDLIGVSWDGGGHLHGEVRVRARGAAWSPWVPLGDHGVPGVSDPVWAGGADELQLRLAAGARDVRVRFVNSRGVAEVEPVAHAAANQPTVITRAQWDPNNECPPRGAPEYGQVLGAVVHHTVSANEYSPQDSAAIVLAICKYHRNSNGWADIGYNFLVDKFGQIFEGRAGGIDQAVIGAQAQGYNGQTTGISNIGTFSSVPQSDVSVRAMSQLIAWKLGLHGAPTQGPVTLTSAGGSTNRYPSGSPVTVDRICGHRDLDNTDCPGGALYGQLDELRRRTAGEAPATPAAAALTANVAASKVTVGDAVTISGRLSVPAAPGPKEVQIQKRSASGHFGTVARVATDGDGGFNATVYTTRGTAVRALWPGAGGLRAVASPAVRITVVPRIEARARARRVAAGGTIVVAGRISPSKRQLQVEIARRGTKGYAKVGAAALPARRGGFAGKVRLPRAGFYRLTVSFPGDARNGKVAAPSLFVRATPARRSRGRSSKD